MPLAKYFGGHGAQVMKAMQKEHGAEEGERMFYKKVNKRKKPKKGRGSLLHGEHR